MTHHNRSGKTPKNSNKKRKTRSRRRKRQDNRGLDFQRLEDRQLMALTAIVDAATSALIIEQTADDGPVLIQKSSFNGSYSISDSTTTLSVSDQPNLQINLGNFNTDLTFSNNDFVSGDVSINLGDGDKTFRYDGKGSIGGDLNISGGAEDQNVRLSPSRDVGIGGDLSVNLGDGFDEAHINDHTINGAANLVAAGEVRFRDSRVNQGVDMADPDPDSSSILSFEDTTVLQGILYTGGNRLDAFGLQGSTVFGDVDVDLGEGNVNFFGVSAVVVVEDSTVVGGLSIVSQGETVAKEEVELTNANISGDIHIDLDDGENHLNVSGGAFGNGSSFTYLGGDQTDTVVYAAGAGSVDLYMDLNDADDSLTLSSGEFESINIAFAGASHLQDDEFINEIAGDVDFDVILTRLRGYNLEFTGGDFRMTQLFSTPGVSLGSGGQYGNRLMRFRMDGFSGLDLFEGFHNVTVQMLDNTGTELEFFLLDDITGDLNIDLGEGNRVLDFGGDSPIDVYGNTFITGGAGDQELIYFGGDFSGDVEVDLGSGFDRMTNHYTIDVGGRMIVRGTNYMNTAGFDFEHDRLTIAGNLVFDGRNDDHLMNLSMVNIVAASQFIFFGTELNDSLTFDHASVAGNVFVNFQSGETSGAQLPAEEFTAVREVDFGGNLNLLSTTTEDVNDHITIGSSTQSTNPDIAGNVFINVGAGADNRTKIHASVGGSQFVYRGQTASTVNEIELDLDAPDTRTNIVLGDQADEVTLTEGMNVKDLRIDFGGNTGDSLINDMAQAGQKSSFNSRFLNYQGYSIFGNANVDNTHVVQVEDFSHPGVENLLAFESGIEAIGRGQAAGTEEIWTMMLLDENSEPVVTQFTVTASISFQMLDHSDTLLATAISKPVEGSLRAQLGDGDREMQIYNFTESGETPVGRSTRIFGGEGDQTVNLAVSTDPSAMAYASTFLTTIDLGDGNDTLEHDQDVNVGGAFILTGVNAYVNRADLAVGFNMTVNNTAEFQMTDIVNQGSINVDGNLTFLGSDAVDSLRLDDNVEISGNTFIDLKQGATGGGIMQSALIGDSRFNRLTVTAGNATNGNFLHISDDALFEGGFVANFNNDSYNHLVLGGSVSAGEVTVRGGSHVDEITFGMNADHADATISTFSGEDFVVLNQSADVSTLTVNFGDDVDQFFSDFAGAEPFELDLLNLE